LIARRADHRAVLISSSQAWLLNRHCQYFLELTPNGVQLGALLRQNLRQRTNLLVQFKEEPG
jgi:hypothetical protein